MLKFDKEITKVKVLKYMFMNFWQHFNKFYILLKNDTLIKLQVLNMLHFWCLVLGDLVIKYYILKKKIQHTI